MIEKLEKKLKQVEMQSKHDRNLNEAQFSLGMKVGLKFAIDLAKSERSKRRKKHEKQVKRIASELESQTVEIEEDYGYIVKKGLK